MDKMKRTCNSCKALTYTDHFYCSLGYNTTINTELFGIVVDIKPLEICPKPKTNNEYANILRSR